MDENNIIPKTIKKFKATTYSDHNYPVAPNLLNRSFQVKSANVAWVSDITYIRTREGWLYLAAVMDLFSSKVVGWAMDKQMTQSLVIDALKQAVGRANPPRGVVLHSDRGVQYACKNYRNLLKRLGFVQSMSRKGNCWDNAPMESFFGTLKTELVYDGTHGKITEVQYSYTYEGKKHHIIQCYREDIPYLVTGAFDDSVALSSGKIALWVADSLKVTEHFTIKDNKIQKEG